MTKSKQASSFLGITSGQIIILSDLKGESAEQPSHLLTFCRVRSDRGLGRRRSPIRRRRTFTLRGQKAAGRGARRSALLLGGVGGRRGEEKSAWAVIYYHVVSR